MFQQRRAERTDEGTREASSPTAESLSQLRTPDHAPSVDRSTENLALNPRLNVEIALQLSAEARTSEARAGKFDAFHNRTVGAVLLGCAAANLYLAPPWPFQHPISNGIALLCGAIGALSIVRAFRIEHDTAAAFNRSSRNDAIAASPDLDSIQETGPAIQQLFSQGERCISYLGDSAGAQLFAKGVCGLIECVEQLGSHSPEAARLIARIDGELTNRYTNLPALKELARFALSNARSLAATLEEPQTRAAFARSLCTLAREGGCETNVEMQATAAILYSFARDLAPANQHMRIELLETAHRMTGAYDGIRENIESQLREIGECSTCSGAASDSDAVRARTIMKRLKVSSSPS